MKIKQTVKQLMMGAVLMVGLTIATVAMPPTVSAECDPAVSANCCGGVNTAIVTCDQKGSGTTEDTGLWGILLLAINILTAGVGIAAIGGFVFAGIMYTTAGGNPEQVKKAMGMITNIVIGVVAYAGMYAGLNFLVPGGLFN